MQDIKIGNIKLNAREELSLKITVKPGDYTDTELQLLKQAEINGDMLDIQFTGLVSGDVEKQRKEKISKLAFLMLNYCDKANISIEEEKIKLYQRQKVKSRSELNNSQLDYEIELYKNGLLEFNS